MKTAALKFLAVGGVALAAYPVVISIRPDIASPKQNFAPSENNQQIAPSLSQNPTRSETALSLSIPQTNSTGGFAIIQPDPSGHFTTKAYINGVSISVMFDTGATIVALSFEDATKLGIRLSAADFRSQIQTANGLAPAADITLKEVRIDTILISNVSAMVLPPGKLETSLIGRSFWGRLKTGFSYASGNLILKN